MSDVAVHHHEAMADAYEPSLFGTYSKKIGMWLFLLSDSLTFGALLWAYTYGRVSTPNWPTPFHSESIRNATVMTAFLLTSSLTMVFAVRAAALGNAKAQRLWLLATMACGTAFVILHGREWSNLIAEGLTLPFFPTPPGHAGAEFSEVAKNVPQFPQHILRHYRNAHASRDHRGDLPGNCGAEEVVHSHSAWPVAGGMVGNAHLQSVSRRVACAVDRRHCVRRDRLAET